MIFFREPAKQLVSLYNYKYKHVESPPSFSMFYTKLKLKGNKNFQATNFYRHYLKINYFKFYFFKDFNFFKRILDNFWYVGVTENIDYDLKKIAKELGIKKFEINRKNISDERPIKHLKINQNLRDKLNNENELDYKLYNYAKRKKYILKFIDFVF